MIARFPSAAARLPLAAALAAALLASGCAPAFAPTETRPSVADVELLYQQTRALRDAIDVTRRRGAAESADGVPLAELIASYTEWRTSLATALAATAVPRAETDARALAIMRRALESELAEESVERAVAGAEAADCAYDPAALLAGPDGIAALSERIYACFSQAADSLVFDGEKTDRLTIFGRLALLPDAAERERLWRALEPMWRAVNGGNGPSSPYRALVRANAARLRESGEALGASVRGIGVEPAQMEAWLERVLERWREISPDSPLEPWDFAYQAGRANRALSQAIPLSALRPVNDRFYRDLGADPLALGVRYDLEPRAGKDPVAVCTFGRRPRREAEQWLPAEPWVFAAYRMGGLDKLLELLHETGHAVHIAAIRTRPAFTDWPDSDIFTEGIADIATLEMYEPAWQRRYLAAAVPIADSIAAKYAAIVMDIAWALFELRVHREPERDPNHVWTEITQRYFRIVPHPELAWWAVRGQLVDSPGYMMNYAAGAILNADLRARARALHGSYTEGDPGWYVRISEQLYRFGLERSSRQVIEDFLGRPVSPDALLDDMARGAAASLR